MAGQCHAESVTRWAIFRSGSAGSYSIHAQSKRLTETQRAGIQQESLRMPYVKKLRLNFAPATSVLIDRAWLALALLIIFLPAPEASAKSNDRSTQCLALAMYWEARGEGRLGMEAVGSVVLNRVRNPKFPRSVCDVVFQGGESPPCQFSWWCDGKSDRPRDAVQWRQAIRSAEKLLSRPHSDPTQGALYFHSTTVHSPWHRRQKPTVRIGGHVFYR